MISYFLPIGIGIAAAIAIRLYQQYKKNNIQLTPNCLLTKYPLIFLNKKNWHHYNAPSSEFHYLQAHGYDALSIAVKNSELQDSRKLLRLRDKYAGAHLFYDKALSNEIADLQKFMPNFFHSQYQMDKKPLSDYLNHAISLAEQDFQCSIET